jgi:hypothetical protein
MSALIELEKARAALIVEHQNALKAFDMVIELLRKHEAAPKAPVPPSSYLPEPTPLLENPTLPPRPAGWPTDPRTSTLKDFIRALVLDRHPSKDWTSRDVWEELRLQNVEPAGRDRDAQINNVSTVMAMMSAPPDMFLIQTYKGAGRNPNKYRVRTAENEKEVAEATSSP